MSFSCESSSSEYSIASTNTKEVSIRLNLSGSDTLDEDINYSNRFKVHEAGSSSSRSSNENENILETNHIPNLEEESDSSSSNEVLLSVYWKNGMLGAAAYSVETSEISVLHDVMDVNPDFHLMTILYHQVQPTKVILCSTVSTNFVNTLKKLVNDDESPGRDLADQKTLIFLPGKEYVYETCKRRILKMKLLSAPDKMDEDEQTWYIQSILHLTSESMVLALGMLLKCLEKSFVLLNFEKETSSTPIAGITYITLEDSLMIDTETLQDLQIFNQLKHPSNFKIGTKNSAKEGVSVYGIFNRCRTTAGSKQMRLFFLRPLRDIKIINARLDVVEFCFDPRNTEAVRALMDHLKSIKSINAAVTRLVAARATIKEWKTIHKTIFHCLSLGELCEKLSSQAELFNKIAKCNTEELRHVIHCINSIVDFTESERVNKFSVKEGVDAELDRKKQKYGALPELMSTLASTELKSLPPYVAECSAVYIPEIGFLLAIPQWKSELSAEEMKIPELELMFTAGNTLHYKSHKTRHLDCVLGDCAVEIAEHESRIMVQLVQFIQEHLNLIRRFVLLAAELDCLIAMAAVAQENNYVRPVLEEGQVIEIKDGRHPLQELFVSDFVPNDTLSSESHGLMKILTGPNSCGKSIYLKQVALIAYLAQIGSFVPASKARIGVLQHIHTCIQTVESIATQMSGFALDVKRMVMCLSSSPPSSLLVIDEFGKGTEERAGLSLLAAFVQSFLERGELCPHIFVSTHFHRLASLLPPDPQCSFQTFECMFDEREQIVYLYKLKTGRPMSSFAVKVLKSVEVGSDNVAKAIKFLEAGNTNRLVRRDPNNKKTQEMQLRADILYILSLLDCRDFKQTERNALRLPAYLQKYKNLRDCIEDSAK